jgi:hypothetical protein
MIVKFSGQDLEVIVRNYLDELIYGVADMEVEVTVPKDTVIVCKVEIKENK